MGARCKDAADCWKEILSDVSSKRDLLTDIEGLARSNDEPTVVVFGTSGWRGEIGSDFTMSNVRVVTAAIINVMKAEEPDVMKAMGVKNFEEIRRRGVIVGHDNRLLGPEFAGQVIGLLKKEGIRVYYAGEAPTPEFSAAIEMLNAACSINLTPSHNPANYGGFKFNPSDGGPAGPELTEKIEAEANLLMRNKTVVDPVEPGEMERIDTTALYLDFLKQRRTIDMDRVRSFVESEDCLICIDNVHGSTRGRIQRLIGENPKMIFLRTDDDPLFGGVAPEPSDSNMAGVRRVLSERKARFRLGVILDPDGDRIRHADAEMIIPMNYFGAMALHFLYVHKGFRGVAVKSVGTSNLVNAVAKGLGIPVRETKVGFKNFRPFMVRDAAERAIVCFEESDGISGYNHTLEKDAIFGILLAVEMMAVSGKNLSEYLSDIMDEFGRYYPDRSGIEVDRSLAGDALKSRLSVIRQRYPVGSRIEIGGRERTVADVITVDGTKLVFDDGSWLMIRPSGTEPKVRFYIESRTEEGKKAVFETAERMTREALGI